MFNRLRKNASSREGSGIRLLAIDLDGTLLRSDQSMSQASVDAVKACGKRGIHVVIATARPPRAVRSIYQQLGLNTPTVNYNGALIYEPNTETVLQHQMIDAKVAKAIIQTARQIEPRLRVSIERLDKWYTDFYDPLLPYEFMKTRGPTAIGPLDAYLNEPLTKLLLLGEATQVSRVRAVVTATVGSKIAFAASDPRALHVVHPRVDKAEAVRWLTKRLGIGREQVMAIGDAPNDVELLRWAGVGVAMLNAYPQAIQVADHVVPSNDDNGVAHAVARHIMGTNTQSPGM